MFKKMTASTVQRIRVMLGYQEGPGCPFTQYANRTLETSPVSAIGHGILSSLRKLREFNQVLDNEDYCESTGGGPER